MNIREHSAYQYLVEGAQRDLRFRESIDPEKYMLARWATFAAAIFVIKRRRGLRTWVTAMMAGNAVWTAFTFREQLAQVKKNNAERVRKEAAKRNAEVKEALKGFFDQDVPKQRVSNGETLMRGDKSGLGYPSDWHSAADEVR